MSEIAKFIGQRIRNYRTQQNLSQEKLAEMAGCPPTYIGQLERGERTLLLKAWKRIAPALNTLFPVCLKSSVIEQEDSHPLKCYEFVSAKTKAEQKHLYKMLIEMDKYKNK